MLEKQLSSHEYARRYAETHDVQVKAALGSKNMIWQREFRKEDEELSEQERRHLGAVKLFLESVNSRYAEPAVHPIDEMPSWAQRRMIESYHLWLEDPHAFALSRKLPRWICPFGGMRNGIAKILSRFSSLR